MPLKIIIEFLEELKKLRKERADKAPFESLLEFEEWADSVQPLLSFHEGYEREFKQAVTSATVTDRIGSLKDANNNMNSAVGILNKAIKTAEIQSSQRNVKHSEMYVSLNRINEIENLNSGLDFSKLCMLLRELNTAYENELYYSTGCLIRAILDHVPPVFGCNNFNEVANNYQGLKSFKDAMRGLNEQIRKVTDSYLHTQLRKKEVLPVQQQVEARSSLDLLLSEIIRITYMHNHKNAAD